MNQERIQQVLSIEKEAKQIYETAIRESEQLLSLAHQDVETILEKAKKEARQQAEHLLAEAQAKDEDTHFLSALNEKMDHAKNLSRANLESAVDYVLDRVIGRS